MFIFEPSTDCGGVSPQACAGHRGWTEALGLLHGKGVSEGIGSHGSAGDDQDGERPQQGGEGDLHLLLLTSADTSDRVHHYKSYEHVDINLLHVLNIFRL